MIFSSVLLEVVSLMEVLVTESESDSQNTRCTKTTQLGSRELWWTTITSNNICVGFYGEGIELFYDSTIFDLKNLYFRRFS